MSDYHHLKPAVWKKRVSTCEFSQPRANGHGRSISRFTVISTAAETETDTSQSYDPYRGSRVFPPLSSQVSHAKITIHRDRPSSSGTHGPQTSRRRSGSSARHGRPGSARGAMPARPPSSRGSLTSLQSSRNGTPHARKPSLRHKRGVDFSQARKRSNSVKGTQRNASQPSAIPPRPDRVNYQRANTRSMSPELPIKADGTYPMARGAPVPAIKTKEPDVVFTEEELRHFSSNIAKDCDDAFRSSLIADDSIAGSLGDSERKQRDSPFAFSMDSEPYMTPATEMSIKSYDSRPLPPLPSERTLHSQTLVSPRLNSSSATTLAEDDDAYRGAEQIAQIAVPVTLGQYGDRRVVSAPVQTHSNKKLSMMPPINENSAVNVVSTDKVRIVSAPPHTPRKRFNGQAQGMEYLTRVENSIRVVHSPTGPSPVKIPEPLKLQKKGVTKDNTNRQVSYQRPVSNEGSGGHATAAYEAPDGVAAMKKKKSWFKRASKTKTENGMTNLRGSQDQLTLVDSNTGEEPDAASATGANKKRSFSFPFWKTSKSSDLRMSIAGMSIANSLLTSFMTNSKQTTIQPKARRCPKPSQLD